MNITLLRTDTARLEALMRALQVGVERIHSERDYSDPENLAELLQSRGCEILDRDALDRVLAADPGPLYYGDIGLCDNGDTWEQRGGPWADRLEHRLVDLGAVRRQKDPDAACKELAGEVKEALESDSNDAEHDALVSVAEHLGVDWTPPDC